MAERDRSVYRRIYFYRIENPQDILAALPDDLARIANLPFNEQGRYINDGERERLCLWPDSLEFPLRLRFGRTRLQNLPTKERGGKLEALGLEADAGLAELCHIVIFADGYVAAEFNFEAPRIKRLGTYLFQKKYKLPTKPVFLPLFQKDILQLVQGMSAINFLELRGVPDAKYLLSEADSDLGSAYGTIGALGADRTVHLGLRAHKQPDSKLKKLSAKLAQLTQRNPWDMRVVVNKLTVSGINSEGKFDEVDLLEDHLIAVKQFEKQSKKDKAISSGFAYRQIETAFEERKGELAGATVGRMLI